MKDFYVSNAEISALAYGSVGGGKFTHEEVEDLVVRDPEFYFEFLRSKYYHYFSSDIYRMYPDLTFKQFNDSLRIAIVDFIRSFYPESMRGGILI